MKLGLRPQILLLLGALMVLAFVPLYFAVATYTTYTLEQVRHDHARWLARGVAARVLDVRAHADISDLLRLLSAEAETGNVEAIGVYDDRGKLVARVGRSEIVDQFTEHVAPGVQRSYWMDARARGFSGARADPLRVMAVITSDPRGAVITALAVDPDTARARPLMRLVGLYMTVFAAALLMVAYFALTRLIVRPVDRLSRAAERVAGGARGLEVPMTRVRELNELGVSLATMTQSLINKEQALREQIDQVERATRELKQAQDRLVRSERLASVGRLAAGLAHEIGNPVAALIGMEDLLLDGELSEPEQRDFLQRMRKETERISRILRDLLQFARPSTSDSNAPSQPGDVEAAIFDTAALVAPQKAMQDLKLHLDVEPDLPRVALALEQLVQVFLNLVLNGVDACKKGGSITVRARASSGVTIEVEDTGPGVAPEIRDRLFEPFVTTKEVGKGTGLGLAVCRGLVESVGGNIALDAEYTGGARFVVTLPAGVARHPHQDSRNGA
ncbi:MAG TPA: HAMP domain-containing sensor histidine kinase [Polyangiaceae bacterium]|jgi:signal transduction histidine kinase